MKLSLAMIAKDEKANLERLYPLIKDYIDDWVVVVPPKDEAVEFLKSVEATVVVKDFTTGVEPEIIERFKDYGLDVDADYRLFQFAAARNESFKHATGDYILWLDADDEPVGLAELREFIAKTPRADQFDCLYDYSKDAQGNSTSDHIRERVVRNNGNFEWKGAELGLIHETIVPKPGFNPLSIQVSPKAFRVVHHSDHADQSSIRNHIALLYEYIKTRGKDARTTYYLGVEFFNRGMYEDSIKIMQEYVRVGGWDEERYRAWLRMAEAYHQLGDVESSRNAYLNATKELPHYPDAYLGLGESYYSTEEWGKAIEFIMTGLQKPVPKTKSALDMTKYTFRATNFIALAYHQLGKQDRAYEWFKKAEKANPNHPWVVKYAPMFQDIKDLDDYVRSFVKLGQISKRLYPKTLSKLAEAIPDELMDQELLLGFKRQFSKPKIWDKKSVVFFCSAAFEEWGPDSLERGCGGSEEAVIHLSRRFAKMGWEVTVFNNCPEEKVVDGVSWQRYERFNPRDIFNILIAWRNNPFLEPKVADKKFIDVHDVPTLQYFPAKSLKDVTLLVKSRYHRELFPHLEDNNFKIIPNGIDPEQFANPKKIKNNLCWTSSYDRGLEYLLEMWPEIKKEVPDATIDIAYGWNLFDTSNRGKSLEGRAWKAKMEELFEQEGVTVHGRLNSNEVARLYNQADVWAYPTDFPEISCITAMKAQQAGAIPVSTDYAALKETVKHGVVIRGSAEEEKVRQDFQKEVIALLKDEARKTKIRENMSTDFSWDAVAQEWDKLFKA